MAEVTMPRLSDSMEDGTIIRWLRSDGETIQRGDELVEVETDKATIAYEAPSGGVLRIVAREGETVAVGDPIASVLAEGEATPVPAAAANGHGAPARLIASPIARRIARERGIELGQVDGSGPGGRIVKADVMAAAAAPAAPVATPPTTTEPVPSPQPATPAVASSPSPAPSGSAKGDVTIVEPTRMQQVVARRMAEAKTTVPEFAVQVEIDMEEALALRTRLKALTPAGQRPPSINDMVVKASALALRDHPHANGAFVDGAFHRYSRVNVGVAVAAPGALVVPTVLDADRKSLGEIARETLALATKVRDGTIAPADVEGGTFTVSNLGMFGTTSFTAVINAPQAAILAVGAVSARAAVHDGVVCARQMMTATLTCDHRILYGADAAALLARIRELLENPLAMAL
jgi:pyruvate dehydrogenase E2 component (dihydrolipoamide acetyltransferase)